MAGSRRPAGRLADTVILWRTPLARLSLPAGDGHNDWKTRGGRAASDAEPGGDMGKISIATPQETVPVDRAFMRNLARAVLEGEGALDAQISLAFVDNPTIHRLNKQYLDHDEPTDVLSFPLSEPGARKLTGELVIGAEVALAQAQARGHDV